MSQQFIENKFWNKPILEKGTHIVKITCIENGTNTSGTPFIICIFENKNGYFPHKINLKLKHEQNFKYLKNLYTAIGLEQPLGAFNNYELLVNKKLSIYIGRSASINFGIGLI